MTELIQLLQSKVGITADQAEKSLHTIKEFVVTKFPMLAGAVENMFGASAAPVTATPVVPTVTPVVPKVEEQHSVLDKISDVIPGETGQKIEDFAKNAADKAGDVFENVKEKVSGFFHKDEEKKA